MDKKGEINMKKAITIILGISAILLLSFGTVYATFLDFETETGYDLYAEYCATLERSTEQSFSPTHSIKYYLPADAGSGAPCEMPYARVRLYHTSPLKDTNGTFKTFITNGSSPNLVPYMMFRVDANGNGIYDYGGPSRGDSIVIAFITGG